jgi:hypothetical protein
MRARHATEGTQADSAGTAAAEGGRRDFTRRAIAIALVIVALVAGYFAAAAFIPRWWSHRIGAASNGAFSTGVLLGICFGIVFTVLPLGLLWFTMRRSMRWKTRIMWLVLAVILAAPNLMTLGVAIGTGSGAHAGQRTMDVQAPGFRGATAVGTLIAVLIFVVLVIAYRRKGRPPKVKKSKTPASEPADV